MRMQFGAWTPDLADLDNNGMIYADNCVPTADGYETLPNTAVQSSNALGAGCQGGTEILNASAPEVFVGDATKLYRLTSSGGAFSDVSVGGGYTVAAGAWWDFTVFGSKLLAVYGAASGKTPQTWTIGTSSAFANLGGTPPAAACIATVRDVVMMGNTYDATDGNVTNRVWWSGIADETQWPTAPGTKAAVQSDWQDLKTRGGKVQRIAGGPIGYILQERSITRAEYVGPPVMFRFDDAHPDIGTPAPMSLARVGDDIFFLTTTGFVRFGAGGLQFIGAGRVDNYVLRLLTATNIKFVTACVVPKYSSIAWLYSHDSTPVAANIVLYNYKFDKWSHVSSTAASFILASSIYGGERTLALIDDSNKKLYTHNSSNSMTATLTTGEREIYPGRRTVVQLIRPQLIASAGSTPAVTQKDDTRNSQQAVSTTQTALTYNSATDLYQGRIEGRFHRFTTTLAVTSGSGKINGIDLVDASKGGRA